MQNVLLCNITTVKGKIKNPLCMFISTLITISSHFHDGRIHDYVSEREDKL